MTKLNISPDLSLPIDIAGEAIGILATRGAGKSYTSAVLVEELWAAKIQLAVLDPTGVYWGLRASADGKTDGLPIIVLGGAHGDAPLEPTAGSLIADVLVDTGQSLILDFSDFGTKGEQTRFVTAFAERLYARKARARSTLHVIVDEANEFAPQKPMRDEARMLGAMERAVGKGRSRGLAFTLISQRSAALNKNVLDLIDSLVVMRIGSSRDRTAVRGWFTTKALEDEAGLMDTLPGLPTGEAWVWSPVRDILARVHVRRIGTFDSYRTPKPGERQAEPRALAPIDVKILGAQIEATKERAKADDPKELRRTIANLQRRIAEMERGGAKPVETVEVEKEVRVEVPVFRDGEVDRLLKAVSQMGDVGGQLVAVAQDIGSAAGTIGEALGAAQKAPAPLRPVVARPTLQRPPAPTRIARRAIPAPAARRAEPLDDDISLKAGARRILATFARHYPMRMSRAQLGTLAKFKITGGTFQTYFSQLRRLGYLQEREGLIEITPEGLDYIGHVPAEPMSTEEILEQWRGALKAGARRMLDLIVERYPDGITRQELADALDMTATGGTFQTYLSTLRRNGLIEIDGDMIRASGTLFVGASA